MMIIDAYIDPGTGSLMLQAILGAIAAFGVTMRLYGRRILTFLRIRKGDSDVQASKQAEDSTTG